MEPHDFRRQFNALLQALRSVVLLVERQKRVVPDGVAKLEAWRAATKLEPYAKWGQASRDVVVHEADLVLNSTAEIEYSTVGRDIVMDKFNLTPNVATDQIIGAMLLSKPEAIRQGVLTVTRRWVASDLPDSELLGVARELYESSARLVQSIHDPQAACDLDLVERECSHGAFRLPSCMLALRDVTAVSVDIATRERLIMKARAIEIDADFDLDVARERYGQIITVDGDPIRTAMAYLRRASLFLTVDSEALPFMTLFKGAQPVDKLMVGLTNPGNDVQLWRSIADRIRDLHADGFTFSGESWTTHHSGVPRPVHTHGDTFYDVKPERGEALNVVAATEDGRVIYFSRAFTRDAEGWPVLSDHISRSFQLPTDMRPLVHAMHS